MKNFFSKYLGLVGLAIYYFIAVIIRIPVALFMLIVVACVMLVYDPIAGKTTSPDWFDRLYKWYCGK